MYSRRTRRHSRRRPASHGPVRRLGLVVAGTSVPVLVTAYAAMAPHGERAVDTASVSASSAWAEAGGAEAAGTEAGEAEAGGWGRGGYMMMPGPGGPAARPSAQARRHRARRHRAPAPEVRFQADKS